MTDLPLIGRGRAADVYDVGDGRVLRRYRSGRADSVARKVCDAPPPCARCAGARGVLGRGRGDIVMERLDGPTMLEVLKAKPWRAAAIGRDLAAILQRRFHAVPAGDIDLPRVGDGDSNPRTSTCTPTT